MIPSNCNLASALMDLQCIADCGDILFECFLGMSTSNVFEVSENVISKVPSSSQSL